MIFKEITEVCTVFSRIKDSEYLAALILRIVGLNMITVYVSFYVINFTIINHLKCKINREAPFLNESVDFIVVCLKLAAVYKLYKTLIECVLLCQLNRKI